jgi:hypothetical protein
MTPIAQHIVALVQEWDRMDTEQRRNSGRGKGILHDIHLIGQTAAFFGDYDGMKELHDAAEALVGRDNSVGYWLNTMWDGIGSWQS